MDDWDHMSWYSPRPCDVTEWKFANSSRKIAKAPTAGEVFGYLYCFASHWIFINAAFFWQTCKTAIGYLKWWRKWISHEIEKKKKIRGRKYKSSSVGASDGHPPLKWLFELGEIRNINNSDTCPHPRQQMNLKVQVRLFPTTCTVPLIPSQEEKE